MSTKYNETFDGPLTHKYEDVKRFAQDAMLQTRLKRENFAEYQSYKEDWRKCPELAPPAENSREFGERTRRQWSEAERPRAYSQYELVARGKYPETTVREVMNGNYFNAPFKSIGELAKTNPAEYCRFELAKASYNIGGRSVAEAEARLVEVLNSQPVPVEPEKMHTPKPEVALRLNLPADAKLDEASSKAADEAFKELVKADVLKAVNENAEHILNGNKQDQQP